MADRKAELERKRAKLDALRAEKARKQKEKEQLKESGQPVDQGPPSLSEDEYWKSLGIEPPSAVMTSLSHASGENSLNYLDSNNISGPPSKDPGGGGDADSRRGSKEDAQKRRAKLTVSQVTQTNIPAHEKESYSKETQTALSGPDNRDSHAFDYYDEYNPGLEWDDEFSVLTFDDGQEEDGESSLSLDQRLPKLPPGILRHGMPEAVEIAPALTEVENAKIEEEQQKAAVASKPKHLSEEQKQMIIMSSAFQRFVDRSTRVMERALTEQAADIFIDYRKSGDDDDNVFATVDGDGKLDIWNLNNDTELPTASARVEGPAALNRVSWTQSGLHVVAGDDMGKISVYDVGESPTNPQPDDWQRFSKTLAEIKYNQTGDDLDQEVNITNAHTRTQNSIFS